MKVLLSVSVLTTLVVVTSGMTVRSKRSVDGMADASEYLARLGYYMDSTDFQEDNTRMALMRFQKAFNLPMTGTLNAETMDKMNQPRCLNPDTGMMDSGARRRKRYARQGSKWPKLELTYKVTKYTNDLPRSEIDVIVRESFRVWSDVTPLRFYRSDSDDADILILFVVGDHGDGGAFDGPGGTYAHAYYPQYGGDAHFDDDERWTIGTTEGVNFFQVCVHEFGHSLGLLHSGVENSIMEPYYQGYRPGWRLHQDDIDGIQSIYGSRDGTTPRTTSTTTRRTSTTTRPTSTTTRPTFTSTTTRSPVNPGADDACTVARWDAVVTDGAGDTYFFAGDYYYKLGDSKRMVISEDWQGVSGNIDSAIFAFGFTIIFKGDRFHLFRGTNRYDRHVRESKRYFRYLPDNMDTAFIWPGNNKMYVTKGLDYWRHSWSRQQNYNYPRVFAEWWPGVPPSADAANRYTDNNLHFFLGNTYYIFNTKQDKVVGEARSVGVDFFGCENNVPMNPSIPDHPDRVNSNFDNPQDSGEMMPMVQNSEMGEMQAGIQLPDEDDEEGIMMSFQDPSGFIGDEDDSNGAAGVKTSAIHVTVIATVIAAFRLFF